MGVKKKEKPSGHFMATRSSPAPGLIMVYLQAIILSLNKLKRCLDLENGKEK